MADITITNSCSGASIAITGSRKTWATGIYNGAQKLALSAALKKRAGTAALMTALVESTLLMYANSNVPSSLSYAHDRVGSDHDSLGLMQQRPSSGWGSVANLMNAEYNSRAFYGGPTGPNNGSPEGLLDKEGWETGDLGVWCQRVQVSAFPDRYSCWEAGATQLYDHIASEGGGGGGDNTDTGYIYKLGNAYTIVYADGTQAIAYPTTNQGIYILNDQSYIYKLGNAMSIVFSDGSQKIATPTTNSGMFIFADTGTKPEPPPDPNTDRFVWPFPLNVVTSEYGQRRGRLHAGMDFSGGPASEGAPIRASASGRVQVRATTGQHGGYGNCVVLDHGDGLATLYAHMLDGSLAVSQGQTVTQGQVLGKLGNTGASRGNHLHFETHEGGYRWNASSRNPRLFFPKHNG